MPNPNTESDWIDEMLDELKKAYGPPKFSWQDGDNHIAAAKAEARTLILQKLVEAQEKELESFTHSDGSIHILADKVSYKPANHNPIHNWPIIDGKVIIIPQSYIKDRLAELSTLKKELKQ